MKPSLSPRIVLAVLSLAAFMASLDLFIVNVAFDDIGREFGGASMANLSWVLNGYAIVYAATLVPLGRLADRFGRKTGFLLGMALFTIASVACAISTGLWMLVACRVLQAIGAALLTPTSMALLISATPIAKRPLAIRIWSASAALGAAVGPVVGGLLVASSWRWVFLVNLPVGVVALIGAARWVPESRDSSAKTLPDLIGAAQIALVIGALALALVKGNAWGWSSPITIATLTFVVVGLRSFWLRSLRHPSPVVEPALLGVRTFAWANVAVLAFSVGFAANLLANILWMQNVWGYSPLQTGLGIAPAPLIVLVFSMIAQLVSRRVSVGRISALGCVLCGIGAVAIRASVGVAPAYLTEMLPGWLTFGAGVGLALPTMLSVATVGLPPSRTATGSAIVTMGRQVGSVLGVSLLVALLGHPETYDAKYVGFERVWLVNAVIAGVAALSAFGMTSKARASLGVPVGGTLDVVSGD
jgi:EmrB/QacA subfamily drug resistance transporter